MKTAYIFHDAFSNQYADWYPWMKTTLEGFGYTVFVPSFPTPAAQSYESWKAVIKNYIATFNEETIFIGHGVGGTFALRLAEECTKQIHGLFLVASYAEKINHAGYDHVNESFVHHEFNWELIKQHALVIELFSGEGDPFVPESVSQSLATNLGKSLHVIPDGGHINKASGFIQAVAVAQVIKEGLGTLATNVITDTPEEIQKVQQPVGVTEGIEFDTTVPVPAPAAAAQLPPQPPKPANPAVHTMYQDMSHLVNSNQGSVASSLLTKARSDEAVKQAKSPANPKNILYTIGSLILIIAAIAVLWLIAQKYITVGQNALAPTVLSIVSADTHQKIDVANKPSYTIASAIEIILKNKTGNGTVSDIYYVDGSSRISFPKLLELIDITTLPPVLVDEFTPAMIASRPLFMHGMGTTGSETAHFIVIPIEHYDSVFANVREWEPYMLGDVGIFMNIPKNFLKTYITRNDFQDELITNRSVRVMRYHAPAEISNDITNIFTTTTSPYQENDIMLAYFFLNDHTFVIVDNISIIPELLKRYANSQIYQ